MSNAPDYLFPCSDLYAVLVRHLAPADYLSALRADPRFWRIYRDKQAALPRVAAVVRALLQRALLYNYGLTASMCMELMRLLDEGEVFFSGHMLTAILADGMPDMCVNGLETEQAVDFFYILPPPVRHRMVLEAEESDGDDPPPGPRKVLVKRGDICEEFARQFRDQGLRMRALIRHDDDDDIDYDMRHLANCTTLTTSAGSRLLFGGLESGGQGMQEALHDSLFLFGHNLLSSRGLYVRNLESILQRRCTLDTAHMAQRIALTEDVAQVEQSCRIVQRRIQEVREMGYEVDVLPPKGEGPILFTSSRGEVTKKIRKRLLGTVNPPHCIFTVECDCHEMREFGEPWPNCMNRHNCRCDACIAWRERARVQRDEELRGPMEARWREMWREFTRTESRETGPQLGGQIAIAPPRGAVQQGPLAVLARAAKRLKFE